MYYNFLIIAELSTLFYFIFCELFVIFLNNLLVIKLDLNSLPQCFLALAIGTISFCRCCPSHIVCINFLIIIQLASHFVQVALYFDFWLYLEKNVVINHSTKSASFAEP